ncbi:MarR family transcriptional regulator [Sodalis sp. dw_96]|uniref:MarR family winged helix-turn-helix transcriptional regulator n=1 Tax=Sodalis sp. dw_96 TaxID=2719794 RepID=UPI001BD2B808|nr:MarR family transcriptional regulator [Sodalis sp. dw_96]
MSIATVETSQDSFVFMLVTAARLMGDLMEAALRNTDLGITPGEARTLAVADRLGGVRQAELAAAMSIEPMTLVNHLDRLEKFDLIQRKTDPHDRRIKLVYLTANAKPKLRQIRQIFEETRKSAMYNFSETELASFQLLVNRLCEDLMKRD